MTQPAGSVKVTPLVDAVVVEDASTWPDGQELARFIGTERPNSVDADSWTSSARRALRLDSAGPWDERAFGNGNATESDVAEALRRLEEDVREFVTTSRSNGRRLRWNRMECGPACRFQLHAHPNLELIYCIRGALHEIRMDGLPMRGAVARSQRGAVAHAARRRGEDGAVSDSRSNDNPQLEGPDLSSAGRTWSFRTLSAGEWLVNEVGPVHKSFTSTSGSGCVLLVLWGGSHANVSEDSEPSGMDISLAVDRMDERIQPNDETTCECQNPVLLPDTFVPKWQ